MARNMPALCNKLHHWQDPERVFMQALGVYATAACAPGAAGTCRFYAAFASFMPKAVAIAYYPPRATLRHMRGSWQLDTDRSSL